MLKSLIVQLCGKRPDIPTPLQRLRKFYDKKQQPGTEHLVETLRASVRGFSDIYLVLDALDECPLANGNREELLEVIGEIRGWGERNLHLFLTSRKEHDITASLDTLLSAQPSWEINLESRQKAVSQDMATFIDQQLNSNSIMKKWPAETKKNVKDSLVSKADGM